MARFSKATIDQMRENLPAESNIYNPIDVLGDARVDRFRFALQMAYEDENVDSVMVILSPTAVAEPEKNSPGNP